MSGGSVAARRTRGTPRPGRCAARAARPVRHPGGISTASRRLREPVDEACRLANARSASAYRRTGSTRGRTEDSRARDHLWDAAGTSSGPPRE
ncbi:hypothetical protein ACRAWF_17130 [Streptomyces sp. L7]